jgi:hypothetical protein
MTDNRLLPRRNLNLNATTTTSHTGSTIRECPKIPLATCADLEKYGTHHAEECECKEYHGEGDFTCRQSGRTSSAPTTTGHHTTTEGEIWCHGKLSRSGSFLSSEGATFHHGEATGSSIAEQASKQEAAAKAHLEEQQQKQARMITLLGCSGLLLVALVTTLLGRSSRKSRATRQIQQASLDASMTPNNFAERDAEAAEQDNNFEIGGAGAVDDKDDDDDDDDDNNKVQKPEHQVELATFA